MATYTPPPYFPQSSLAPPDKRRYRKFKLVMTGLALLLIVPYLLLAGGPLQLAGEPARLKSAWLNGIKALPAQYKCPVPH